MVAYDLFTDKERATVQLGNQCIAHVNSIALCKDEARHIHDVQVSKVCSIFNVATLEAVCWIDQLQPGYLEFSIPSKKGVLASSIVCDSHRADAAQRIP